MNLTLSKLRSIKHVVSLYAYLLIVWGFYRLLVFQFPEVIEIVIVKPLIWLMPTFYLVKKDGLSFKDIGFASNRLFFSIYLAIILGVIFALEGLLINYIKYKGLNFGANIGQSSFLISFFLSFLTAASEEITFRGYIFTRIWQVSGREWLSNLATGVFWAFIHLPIAVLDWKLDFYPLLIYLVLVFLFSLGVTFVFARTKNIFSSILLHVFWQWPIILFR